MAIKTIHLPLIIDDDDANGPVIVYAADLAAAHGAHLSVTLGVPTVALSLPEMDRTFEAAQERMNLALRRAGDEKAAMIREAVLAKGAEVSTEVIHSQPASLLAAFIERSRPVDIVVTRAADTDDRLVNELAEEQLIGAGRPVLFVPSGWTKSHVLDRALVAWDGGPKAARAIGDALPLLTTARSVEIATIVSDERHKRFLENMRVHLARHLRLVSTAPIIQESGTIGQTLADHAHSIQANLLIAGAYGHSRLREFVFGGTTAHLFRGPPCPLLMSY
jgi:nucleotide-binding universal stress UspA family protein